MKVFWKTLFLAAALGLFIWYISGLGLGKVWEVVARIGPWAPLILLPYLVVYVVDCFAWAQTLPPGRVSFFHLFRIRWAGEAVNNLFPSAYVGGEAAKVLLLRTHGITGPEGTASAVVSKTAQTVAQLIFIVFASLIFFVISRDQPGLRIGIVIVLIGGFLSVAALFWIQKVGFFRIILSIVQVLPFKLRAFEKRRARLLELDETIFGFYRHQPKRFYRATLLFLAGWALDTAEILLVFYLLGAPISWQQAFVMEAFTGVAKAFGMWIPGSLGVQESGIVLVGRLMGLPATLVAAYALIRRARELIFAAIGMLLFYTSQRTAGKTSDATEIEPAKTQL